MDRYIKLHNVDFDDLIKTIDECKGDVYLETTDGDVLNLKSKLCQMIGLSTILRNSEVSEATACYANNPTIPVKLLATFCPLST